MHASKRWFTHVLVAVIVLLCLSVLPVSTAVTPFATPVAHAATFTVTSTADSGPGSLRQAILDAANGDTITFNLPVSSTITLASQIGITKTLTIDASSVSGLTVSGNNAVRVFDAPSPLTLTGMTIANGNASGNGGGIQSGAALTLTNVIVRDSVASGVGGGVFAGGALTVNGGRIENNRASNGFLTLGGGVFSASTLVVSNTQVMSNTANVGGGAFVVGTAAITSTRFISNTAQDDGGGALVLGTAAITGTSFISNTAQDEGGGLFIANSSNSTIRASRLFDNTAVNGGDALYLGSASATMENNFVSGSTGVNGMPVALGSISGTPSYLAAVHNTFVATTPGQGVAINAGKDRAGDTVVLTNTIFADYATALQAGPNPATITANGVLFSNVTTPTDVLTDTASITVTNAYTGTAAFVDPAARDYHLTSASAAIDRGVATSVTTDIDGQTRPQGSAPDLGADEFSNTPPTAANDSYTTAEDTPLTVPAPGVLGNDVDAEGDVLTATLQTAPTTGTLTLNSNGSFTYTPPANFNGSVTFTYVAGDGELTSQPATVTIAVTPVNDPPTISNIANQTTSVGTAVGPISFTVGDVDGDQLTVSASSSNTALVPNANIVLGGSGANRTVIVTPAAGQRGTTTITITVSDSKTQTTATFTLTVGGGTMLHLPMIMR